MRTIDSLVDLIADTDFQILKDFQLDEQALLKTLANDGIDNIEITQVSAKQIQGTLNGSIFTLGGGQLAPVSNADQLLDAIDGAFAQGSFTKLSFSNAGREFLSFELAPDGYFFRSGRQQIDVTASWPASLTDIFETIDTLSGARNVDDLSQQERDSVQELIAGTNLSRLVIRDDGAPLLDLAFEKKSLTLQSSGLTLQVAQARNGEAQNFLLTIDGQDTSRTDAFKFSSANLAELKENLPEIEDALNLSLTAEERIKIKALADYTYINYTLTETATGPFSLALNIRVDQFHSDTIVPAIIGTQDADVIVGTASDDLLIGDAGNDTINGSHGFDTARFYGLGHEYALTLSQSGITVLDQISETGEADFLTSVEMINFDDISLFVGDMEWVDAVETSAIEALVQLYIGYFGRAPDAQGMLFWLNAITDGVDLSQVAALFYDQPETRAHLSAAQDTEGFVAATYAKVLGRAPDAGGLEFWSRVLDAGQIDEAGFIKHMIGGAFSDTGARADQTYLETKTDIGVYFAFIKGLNDVAKATTAMDLFDGTPQSALYARNTIDQMHLDILQDNTSLLIGMSDLVSDPFAGL